MHAKTCFRHRPPARSHEFFETIGLIQGHEWASPRVDPRWMWQSAISVFLYKKACSCLRQHALNLPFVMARSFVVGALTAVALLATQTYAQTEPIVRASNALSMLAKSLTWLPVEQRDLHLTDLGRHGSGHTLQTVDSDNNWIVS